MAHAASRVLPNETKGPYYASSRADVTALLLILGVCIAFYWRAVGHNFFWWDDVSFLIEAHKGLRSLPDWHEGHFLPVFRLLLAAMWRLFHGDDSGYQIAQILIHAAAAWFFYLVLRRDTTAPVAIVFSLCFAAAPLVITQVIIMTMMSEALMLAFFFAALWKYDRPAVSLALLLLSFGSYGAGPVLVAPFALYVAGRSRRILHPTAIGSVILYFVYMRVRHHYLPLAPYRPDVTSMKHLSIWWSGTVVGLKNTGKLMDVNGWVVVFAAVTVVCCVWALVAVKERRCLWLAPAPASLFVIYCTIAYAFRHFVERRHLYGAFVALPWLAALLCGGLDWQVPRLRIAVAALALSSTAMLTTTWPIAQHEIDHWLTKTAMPARAFTDDLMRMTSRYSGPLFSSPLIWQINCHVTLQQFAPIVGLEGREFVSDELAKKPPLGWIYDPVKRAEHYGHLKDWLDALPPSASDVRAFYEKYTPVWCPTAV